MVTDCIPGTLLGSHLVFDVKLGADIVYPVLHKWANLCHLPTVTRHALLLADDFPFLFPSSSFLLLLSVMSLFPLSV